MPIAVAESKEEQLADIFEVESIKEISDLPGLEVVKRLSVFEEICPSDMDHETDGLMQLSNIAGESVIDGLVTSPGIITSQHSADLHYQAAMNEIEDHLYPYAAINFGFEQKKHIAFGSNTSNQNNPSAMLSSRNRKGKNRKFRRVCTVEVSH